MGLSGGSTSTSNSVTGSAQEWARPYATAAAGQAAGVFGQNQGNTQAIADRVSGMIPGIQNRLLAGSPNVTAAQGYNSDVLSGKYLTGNPILQRMIDQAKRSVTDTVDSQFSSAGRYGSGAYTDVLSRNLADAEGNLRYQDYNTQQTRMDQQAALAPALAQSDFIGVPEVLQTSAAGAALPYAGLTPYAGALGALFNGGTQSSVQKSDPGILGGIGSLLSGGAAIFSDRRMKEDVREVGKTKEGLPIYTYRYKGDPQVHMGVMAQEVERKQPNASGPSVGGFKTVNLEEVR